MGLFTAASMKSIQQEPHAARESEASASQAAPAEAARNLAFAPELENGLDQLWAQLRGTGQSAGVGSGAFVVAHWEPGDGATTIATSLALRAAQLDITSTFCMADFDFFNARLSRLAGLAKAVGLSNVLRGEAALEDVLAGTRWPNLCIVPAGHPNVGRGVEQWHDRCRAACERLTERFSYLLLDVPALRDHPSGALWASGLADAVLVVRAGRTRRQVVTKAIRTLRLMRLEVVALALNGREYYMPQWLYTRT